MNRWFTIIHMQDWLHVVGLIDLYSDCTRINLYIHQKNCRTQSCVCFEAANKQTGDCRIAWLKKQLLAAETSCGWLKITLMLITTRLDWWWEKLRMRMLHATFTQSMPCRPMPRYGLALSSNIDYIQPICLYKHKLITYINYRPTSLVDCPLRF